MEHLLSEAFDAKIRSQALLDHLLETLCKTRLNGEVLHFQSQHPVKMAANRPAMYSSPFQPHLD